MTGRRLLLAAAALMVLVRFAAAAGAPVLPQNAPGKSLGVATCANSLCHGAIETWQASNVLQNEYVTWSRSDKHARAYAVLLNEHSRDIARKLGMKQPPHKTALCLDCHTHNPPPAQRGEGSLIADGVGCEACHGPAERWIESHVAPGATHAGNLKHGMYPTASDVARARLCLSCHLGTEQKFVTHKMMAAGHPRMSFELDTFTLIGPAHFRVDADWQKRKGSWDGVRAWAVGQGVAAQELLALLQGPRGRDGLFPELVLFDCHSCHHAMAEKRNSSARQGAGPGVVRLYDANLLMLRKIAQRVDAGGAPEFTHQVARLHSAIAGGNDALAQARGTEALIEALIPRISAYRFTGQDLSSILFSLIDDGLAGEYGDYQGAEQAVMAVQSVADFMGRRGMLRAAALRTPMRHLLAVVANDETYDPRAFEQALRELKTSVRKGMEK